MGGGRLLITSQSSSSSSAASTSSWLALALAAHPQRKKEGLARPPGVSHDFPNKFFWHFSCANHHSVPSKNMYFKQFNASG